MKVGLLSVLLIVAGSSVAIFMRPTAFSDTDFSAEVTPVSQASIPIFAVGIVEGRSSKVESRFETSGRIQEVQVEEGDRIRKGQVLASLDSEELGYRRDLAQAQLAHAHACWEAAKESREEEIEIAAAALEAKQALLDREEKTLERVKNLLASNATPRQQFDDQLATVRVLQAEVRSLEAKLKLLHQPSKPEELKSLWARVAEAEAQMRLSELEYRRTELLAPNDGVVVSVDIQPGELVSSHDPIPAITLIDDSELRIKAFVEEADAWLITPGQAVEVRRRSDTHDPPLRGTVTRVGPQFDEKKVLNRRSDERFDVRTRECWISLDGNPVLLLGAHVDVLIHTTPVRNPAR